MRMCTQCPDYRTPDTLSLTTRKWKAYVRNISTTGPKKFRRQRAATCATQHLGNDPAISATRTTT